MISRRFILAFVVVLAVSFGAVPEGRADEPCSNAEDRGPLQDQSSFAADARSILACAPLAKGERRMVDSGRIAGTFPSLPFSYIIQAGESDASRMTVTLSSRFRVPGTWRELKKNDAEWNAFANECLAAFDEKLRGPSGEKLAIRFATDAKEVRGVARVKIHVDGYAFSGARADSGNWTKDISCTTVLHETLHLLGLHDEYEEKGIGKSLDSAGRWARVESDASLAAYDCRTQVAGSSIMKNEKKRVAEVMPIHRLRTCACALEETGSSLFCRQQLLSWTDATADCPRYTIQDDTDLILLPSTDASEVRQHEQNCATVPKKDSSTFRGRCAVVDPSDSSASLLRPDQFNAIVFPACPGLTARYRACSANAYRTSREHRGEGCLVEQQRICRGEREP